MIMQGENQNGYSVLDGRSLPLSSLAKILKLAKECCSI